MKKSFLISAVLLGAALVSEAAVNVSIGVGFPVATPVIVSRPAPVVAVPVPTVYATPAPVAVAVPPVAVLPAPVVVVPRVVYPYRHSHYAHHGWVRFH